MSSNQPDIAVIVLNWNNGPDTIECLTTVYASKGVSFEVWVVDNGSTDGSLEQIRAAFPQAIYKENRENLGFAEGNNRAIQEALRRGFPYLFLLNNDVVVREDTMAILQDAATGFPKAGAIGPKIYYYDAPTTIWLGKIDRIPETGMPRYRDADVEDALVPKLDIEPTDFVCGCSLWLRSEVLQQVGLFDPRYFLVWEEVDLCRRILDAGYECLYVPHAKVWHKVSRSFQGGIEGPVRTYFYMRNRLLWLENHCSKKQIIRFWREVQLYEIKESMKNIFSPNLKKRNKARATLRGILDYFLRRFGPCPKRI